MGVRCLLVLHRWKLEFGKEVPFRPMARSFQEPHESDAETAKDRRDVAKYSAAFSTSLGASKMVSTADDV